MKFARWQNSWGDDVQETFFVVDDFFGEFDGSVVLLCGSECSVRILVFGRLALPVCSASRRVECFAPDELDTAGRCSQLANLAFGDLVVELNEEVLDKFVFPTLKVFLCINLGASLFCRALQLLWR